MTSSFLAYLCRHHPNCQKSHTSQSINTQRSRMTASRDTTPPRPLAWWQHLSVTWKAISVIVAVAVAASSAALYAQRYVTTDDLAPYRAADRALQDQVLRLERDGAATAASIEAIRRASEDTRDDVRSLLRHLLENPPGRKP